MTPSEIQSMSHTTTLGKHSDRVCVHDTSKLN